MKRQPPRKERQALPIFLITAFVWTWLLWIPPLLTAIREGWSMPSPDNYARLVVEGFSDSQHLILAFIFTLAVYGPLLGAIFAVSIEQGAPGVRRLLANTFNLRVAPKWYLAALLIAAALTFIPVSIAWSAGSLSESILTFSQRAGLFLPILALQLLTSGLGEEPGWRGYLLPRLQERFGPGRMVWFLGLIWAAWHFPLTTIYTLQGVPADVPAFGLVIAVLIGLVSQTIGIVAMTYIYVWFFNRTQSIFLMIFFHALTNSLPFLAPPVLGAWALIVGVFPWIVVLGLRLISGKKGFLYSLDS